MSVFFYFMSQNIALVYGHLRGNLKAISEDRTVFKCSEYTDDLGSTISIDVTIRFSGEGENVIAEYTEIPGTEGTCEYPMVKE